MLVFDQTGKCVKEIGGAAAVEEGFVGVPRPPGTDDVPLYLFALSPDGKVVVIRELTEEDRRRARAIRQTTEFHLTALREGGAVTGSRH